MRWGCDMPPSRQQDEQLLECLRLREQGISTSEIARRQGRSYEAVRVALKKFDAENTA